MKIDHQSISLWTLHLMGLMWLLPESVPAYSRVVEETQESYSVRFQARWQLQLDLTECGSMFAPKRIHCLNETTLANVEPLFDDVICELVTDSIMECNDMSILHFVNSFSGVQYDCQGATFPFTKVEYEGTGSYCNSSVTKSVANFLQVSPVCDNNNILPFASYFQCDDNCNEEVFLNGTYTCQSINTFSPYSLQSMLLPGLAMYTDVRWGIVQPDGCFELNLVSSTVEPTVETSAPPTSASTSIASATPITIPAGTLYSVKYVGRFQQVLSGGCTKSRPLLVLLCVGDIVNVETSDPSIVCSPGTITLETGQTAMACENKCTSGMDCKGIFETETVALEPMGEVYFECQGESTDAVEGSFVIDKGDTGVCTGTDPDGFILYLAQLGVSCPNSEGGRGYVFNDFHSECEHMSIDVGGNYTCFYGTACGAMVCSFEFQQTIVNADHHRFPECISTNNGLPVVEVLPPELPVIDPGTYTAQFKAIWFFLSDSSCVTNPSLMHATCTNGIIKNIQSAVPCEVVTNTTIECSDSGLGGSLIYECKSDSQIPETLLRSFSGTTSCESNTEQLVQSALQLGINCKTGTEESYITLYQDVFVECGSKNQFGSVDNNFTCLSSVLVPSSDSNEYPIPDLEIMTDFRWPNMAASSDLCHTYQSTRQRQLKSSDKSFDGSDVMLHRLRQTADVLLGRRFRVNEEG